MSVLSHYLKWRVGLAKAETQTSEAERDCLAEMASGRKRLAEIGVWHGVSTCRLRAAMAADGVLLAIDPYPVGRLGFSMPQRIAHAEVDRIRNGTVTWLRTTGEAAAKEPATRALGALDFVFIDGDHSFDGLRRDWEAWSPLLAPGGVIALHDSHSSAARQIDDSGSATYTREVILHDARFERIKVVDTLTVLRRLPVQA